jgi:cobalt-zinc-cadmium efflux system membrane fusion protein
MWPRIEGRITSAPAKLGDKVRAGQTLATLDSVDVGEAHAAWTQPRPSCASPRPTSSAPSR